MLSATINFKLKLSERVTGATSNSNNEHDDDGFEPDLVESSRRDSNAATRLKPGARLSQEPNV